jgi:glycosyltransferase involved in cell wall biosynthesis
MKPENKLLVSICCQTYNHKYFIKDAIESFLMQKTTFDYEILLRDDASTDGTTKIVKEFSEKYPELIKPLIYTENQFTKGIKSFPDNVKRAKGKYIAICEGDDYWIDPFKLQKQVDILEANEDYSFVFSPATRYFEETGKSVIRNKYFFKEIEKIDLEWILKKGGGFYPTATAMFKRELVSTLPNWFYLHSTGDYPLAILAALNGKIGYIDDVMVVYRVHGNSLTNNKSIEPGECTHLAKVNKEKNLKFINTLVKNKLITRRMKRYLEIKENYVFFSKCINCKNYDKAFRGLASPNLNIIFRIRLLAKLIWSIKS